MELFFTTEFKANCAADTFYLIQVNNKIFSINIHKQIVKFKTFRNKYNMLSK